MIDHDSRKESFRRPFGAAEVSAEIYLAAARPGAGGMTLRLHTYTGEDRLLPMDSEGDGRFGVTFAAPEKPCVLWYSFLSEGEESAQRQITVYDPAPVPAWWKDAVVYQIFPDRFARESRWQPREPEKRKGSHRFLIRDWDTPVFYPRAEDNAVSSWPFWGGTLCGIEEKLPYLRDLGVTAIYLNPIFEARSNHRYDTANYLRIDPLLGSEEDFASLCRAAAAQGIRIVLDGVFPPAEPRRGGPRKALADRPDARGLVAAVCRSPAAADVRRGPSGRHAQLHGQRVRPVHRMARL